MNKIIYKYPVPILDMIELDLPEGAIYLSCQVQGTNEKPFMWFIADPNQNDETRYFKVVQTGMKTDFTNLEYLGTFQTGYFVGHLFEII